MSFSPPNLFLSKILWNSNLAQKKEKIMSLYPHFSHTWWHWRDAHGAGAVRTGNSSSLLPGGCCPVAEAEALQVLSGSQGIPPLWNNGEKPKRVPRTGSNTATLASGPPELLGLALLLSGPLLPPSCGIALPWEDFQTLQELRAVLLQLPCNVATLCNTVSNSVISKTRVRTLLGFQRCYELSVSMDKCWGLLPVLSSEYPPHSSLSFYGCRTKGSNEEQDHKPLTLQWFNFNPALHFSSPYYGQVHVY